MSMLDSRALERALTEEASRGNRIPARGFSRALQELGYLGDYCHQQKLFETVEAAARADKKADGDVTTQFLMNMIRDRARGAASEGSTDSSVQLLNSSILKEISQAVDAYISASANSFGHTVAGYMDSDSGPATALLRRFPGSLPTT